jgi:hypothetical protein
MLHRRLNPNIAILRRAVIVAPDFVASAELYDPGGGRGDAV